MKNDKNRLLKPILTEDDKGTASVCKIQTNKRNIHFNCSPDIVKCKHC